MRISDWSADVCSSDLADDMREVDRVANDVGFVLQGRRYVDGRIGDDEGRRVPRHVHHIGMADPPLGPEAGRGGHNRAHPFVGIQRAYHQQLRIASTSEEHTYKLQSLMRTSYAV